MRKETFGIVLLSISAVVLLSFLFALQQPVQAGAAIRERDYQLVTAASSDGGEALYVTDNRTGVCAVFSYDPASRSVVLRDAKPVGLAFR